MRDNTKKSHLLGVGLDGKDGHKRITQADRFSIVGGSEETHELMTETVMKTFEDLKRKGKDLDDTSAEELSDIIRKHTHNKR
ncbi:MAG: hypothetical protein E7035_00160 [Verrucomicrobiaceae bacterium]|jgi:hypothetical protein|nr:hypothetical protein [Verrucomicrobiaceae bacterium]